MPDKHKTQELYAAYRDVFDTPSGKLVLHHLMRQGNVLTSSFVQNDPNSTAFHEGQRNIVLLILAMMNVTPQQVEELAVEAHYYQVGE